MVDNKSMTEERMKQNVIAILNTMKEVIIDPAGFFRKMPKSGGFVDPIIFIMGMGLLVGVINLILSIVGLGFAASFGKALLFVVLTPVFAVIFGFVGAAIMFIIWKIMGSQESFETAYRCGAYASAITPVTTIIGTVPYLGSMIGMVWMTYLMVSASIEVHGIKAKIAWIVFGIIFGLFLLINLSATYGARHLSGELKQWQYSQKEFDKMTAEEKGKSVGAFLKGMQKGVEKE
ncbi:MAG: YIP1 family protein [Syntrophales bacterium]|nr:YIP1 family protein [Syntrophales bacterium]